MPLPLALTGRSMPGPPSTAALSSKRSRSTLGVAVCLLLALAVVDVPAAAQPQLPGADTVTLTQARSGHTATLLDDDYVLIAGGTDGQTELASIEVVDPIGMAVEALGSLVVPRTGHTATLLRDGRILFAGGRASDSVLREAELLDPVSGLSESTGAMNTARADHDAVLLDDGRVMLVGGLDGDAPVASAELFDPLTGTFTAAARPGAVHIGGTATLLPGGAVLLTGAVDTGDAERTEKKAAKKSSSRNKDKKIKKQTTKKTPPAEPKAVAELYDPMADRWVAVRGGGGLSGHQATLLTDGRVFLAGGASVSAQLYDPVAGTFTPAADLANARADHTATTLPDGRVLLAGGADAGLEMPELVAFDPASGSLTVLSQMLIPRTRHTATLTSDGRVLLTGGEFAGLALNDILVFDPADASLLPLDIDMEIPGDAVVDDIRTKAEIRAQFGAPEAFASYYYDEIEADGSIRPTSLQTWSYYSSGVEFTFAGEQVIAEDAVDLEPGYPLEVAPYDPDQFQAYMPLEEVVAAAGLDEYIGVPADELIQDGELFLGRQLTWGMKDGELRYVEALALQDDVASAEVD